MKHTIGVDFINFAGLYQVLVHRIGICRKVAFRPVITLHPEFVHCPIQRQATAAGFDIVFVASENEADDDLILGRLGPLNPREIKEIVIMTTDAGYADTLQHKVSQGIVVHWAATALPDPVDGRCRLSRELRQQFATGAPFRFVELAGYAAQISQCRTASRHMHGGPRTHHVHA
ncbi:MAG TPA: hypothetical protein VG102_04040 [Candidatus Paceibacterota bacterium]|jgi:hypothetical protein|nr:hypothetical protein [Candidatus Paceibacterota bacterium]